MWRLKGCPKCKGDLYLDRDRNGWFEECLQCGHVQFLEGITFVRMGSHSPLVREPVLCTTRNGIRT